MIEPGPRLDALIAEKVMDKIVVIDPDHYLEICKGGGDFFGKKYVCTVLCHNDVFHHPDKGGKSIAILPSYSTSISNAFEIINNPPGKYGLLGFELRFTDGMDNPWYCSISFGTNDSAYAETAPLAICMAALKAVGVEVE